MNENEFATGSVPVMVAARIYGKDASWVKVNFTDGSAETTLTVAQKDTKDTGKTDVGKKPASKSAKTGDNSNLIAWFILLAASVCIVGSLRVIRRQRRR